MPINFNIGGFFDKFKNTALKEMALRQVIVDSIEKNSGVKLDLKEVEFKNKIVRIKASPAARNHIFMRKESIIAQIKASMPGFIIDDLQ